MSKRPEIKDDAMMIEILAQTLVSILDDDATRDACPEGKFITATFLMLVADARQRVGIDDYDLLQDIAEAELTDLLKAADKKMKEAEA